jgi:hypothetical protein
MPEQTNIHNQEPDPQFTQRFIDAVGSVRAYNERHTGIGGAMKGLFAIITASVGEEAEEPQVTHQDEAEMEKQLVQLLQTDDLKGMGVTLFDTKAAGVEEADFSEEKPDRPSSLIMLITDGDKFEDVIWHLKPMDEQREQTEQGVATLLSSAVSLVQAFYPRKTPEDSEEEVSPNDARAVVDHQLNLFMELNPALVSQGFASSHAYKTLSEYTAHYASGTLEDYREAEALDLLAGEDRFGPSAWVKDENPEGLNRRWTKAFDLLKSMRDREEPSPYFTELFGKLRADFDTAKSWLDTARTYDDADTSHASAHIELEGQKETEREAIVPETDENRAREKRERRKPTEAQVKALGDELRYQIDNPPPKPPEGAHPARYIVPLREEMEKLASEWERSFALENAAYLSEKEADNGTSEQEK